MPLVGNLDEERLVATFEGTRCLLPINWLAMPERKFEYVLIKTEPGHSFPEHVHGYGDEIYLILGGTGTVYLDGAGAPGRRRRHLPHPARHAPRLRGCGRLRDDLRPLRRELPGRLGRAPLALLGGRADPRRRRRERRTGRGTAVAMTQFGANPTKKARIVDELRQEILSGAIPGACGCSRTRSPPASR